MARKRKGKELSAKELADFLGCARHTVVSWAERKGMPYVQAADKYAGTPWKFDSAEVVEWARQKAIEESLQYAGVSGDGDEISKEEADRRKAVAQAALAEVELDEVKRAVVKVEDVAGIVAGEYAEVRSVLMNVPAKVAPTCAAHTKATEIQDEIERAIADALDGMRYDTDAGDSPNQEGEPPQG
jgi:excisionase family DNA binding protein